jgi:hypothetical protein
VGSFLRAALAATLLVTLPSVARAEESLADRASPAMATAGSVLSVTGSFGLVVSSVLTVSASTCDDDCERRHAWPVALISGLAVAGSIPLLVIGMQPAADQDQAAIRPPRVTFLAAPSGVGLAGSF